MKNSIFKASLLVLTLPGAACKNSLGPTAAHSRPSPSEGQADLKDDDTFEIPRLELASQGKERGSISKLILKNVTVSDYIAAGKRGLFTAPAITFEVEGGEPDYFIYTACSVQDPTLCQSGSFGEEGEMLCGFSAGTFSFAVKACFDKVPKHPGGCGPEASAKAPYLVKSSSLVQLGVLFQEQCTVRAKMKMMGIHLYREISSINLSQSEANDTPARQNTNSENCATILKQVVNWGENAFAHDNSYYAQDLIDLGTDSFQAFQEDFQASQSEKFSLYSRCCPAPRSTPSDEQTYRAALAVAAVGAAGAAAFGVNAGVQLYKRYSNPYRVVAYKLDPASKTWSKDSKQKATFISKKEFSDKNFSAASKLSTEKILEKYPGIKARSGGFLSQDGSQASVTQAADTKGRSNKAIAASGVGALAAACMAAAGLAIVMQANEGEIALTETAVAPAGGESACLHTPQISGLIADLLAETKRQTAITAEIAGELEP